MKRRTGIAQMACSRQGREPTRGERLALFELIGSARRSKRRTDPKTIRSLGSRALRASDNPRHGRRSTHCAERRSPFALVAGEEEDGARLVRKPVHRRRLDYHVGAAPADATKSDERRRHALATSP